MTLDLPTILFLVAAAFVYAAFAPAAWRGRALLVASVVALYWLQPPLPIRFSDYILPTATVGVTVVAWWATRRPDEPAQQATLGEDWRTLAVVVGLVVGLSFMRFAPAEWRLTAGRPPQPAMVVVALAVAGAGAAALARPLRRRRLLRPATLLLVVGLFLTLKAEAAGTAVSGLWRGLTGQDRTLAGAADLGWLGFSYVAFRLIHTLRDRRTGLLPVLSLGEFLTYVVFFPALTAGPIDRAERFASDVRALPGLRGLEAGRFGEGLSRVAGGLFKKFVVADSLAQGLALNAVNAGQVEHAAGLWLLLYGYAWRLYLDFGGYTDIAIGLGLLLGVRLPENFNRPYLRTNLTGFWQSWHMTLSNWARFYVFTPLSRGLLRRERRPSPVMIVLLAQVATMAVIGLWHGVTLNFLIWGLWHGLGLFAHKQWSERTRGWQRRLEKRPWLKRGWSLLGWFLTFHYVVLGWVWFVLPETGPALQTLGRLLGVGW